ncbi:MAG: ABC-type transporter, periplasmic subunit [Actinobacteria bacterium 66_15]|nr:MAG: ABC-type transporter, periplasmic subunit [Actinobacteria bacterium 66_15]
MKKSIRVGVAGVLALTLMLGLSLSAGCGADAEELQEAAPTGGESAERTFTDLAGREVRVPAEVGRVAAIGSGTLRLVVYAGGADRVVGIEELETRPPVARPYTLANPGLLELPVIGAGGPDSTPDAERLLAAAPDVIFVNQIADAEGADRLEEATGIPVVVVSYGSLGLDEPFFVSMELVGRVLGTDERSAEVVTYVRDALEDLAARTADVADAGKDTAYVGALGFKGARGMESTQPKYLPLAAIGAMNVAGSVEQTSAVMIDREQLVAWDPDHIFLDLGGLSLVREDVRADRGFYEGLTAVSEGRVYAQLPFNNYSTNVEVALADAYYAGTVLFPERFADIDPAAKADEIATVLAGEPVYDRLVAIYGQGFGAIDLLGGE